MVRSDSTLTPVDAVSGLVVSLERKVAAPPDGVAKK